MTKTIEKIAGADVAQADGIAASITAVAYAAGRLEEAGIPRNEICAALVHVAWQATALHSSPALAVKWLREVADHLEVSGSIPPAAGSA